MILIAVNFLYLNYCKRLYVPYVQHIILERHKQLIVNLIVKVMAVILPEMWIVKFIGFFKFLHIIIPFRSFNSENYMYHQLCNKSNGRDFTEIAP